MHREMRWTLSHGIDTKITYGQRKQDNAPSCPFKHFLSMSPDSDILPYSPYSLEYCYCCTKNGGAFPGCCLSNFLTPLTIESLFNYWRWYPYSFETTIEQYVVSQHISHFSNYRLLSRNSTFDTTSHFSTRLSALTQKYYPKQITTHPSIAMFVNQCGNNSTTKLATPNETGTSLISSTKEGN